MQFFQKCVLNKSHTPIKNGKRTTYNHANTVINYLSESSKSNESLVKDINKAATNTSKGVLLVSEITWSGIVSYHQSKRQQITLGKIKRLHLTKMLSHKYYFWCHKINKQYESRKISFKTY